MEAEVGEEEEEPVYFIPSAKKSLQVIDFDDRNVQCSEGIIHAQAYDFSYRQKFFVPTPKCDTTLQWSTDVFDTQVY